MAQIITFKIDGKKCMAKAGQTIFEAASENGFYIPTLCHYPGAKPAGSCRICTVIVNQRPLTACSTPVGEGMEIQNETEELTDLRKAVLELLFTEGNHFCPSCEKSGNCELQALAYRYRIDAPRFPYQFNDRKVDASSPKIVHDRNRCILCKRCVRLVVDEQGRKAFNFKKRGQNIAVKLDKHLGQSMTTELASYAMEICPVGSILVKEKGFEVPIGERKYDKEMIGSEPVKPLNL
jgi:[NiFe] hydrogenase diaphorase moiety small subunit